jgi:hypothetical protein
MLVRRFSSVALAAALCLLPAGLAVQPPADPLPKDAKAAPGKQVKLTNGKTVRLVPREQLRIKRMGTRTLTIPKHLKGLAAAVPTVPAAYDWTKGNAIDFPILGNDKFGCCFYAASAHAVQTWNGMRDAPVAFDRDALVNQYLKISGGDNGLFDSQMFPEFQAGIVGPNGPHKILDYMAVNPADAQAVALAQWAFGGTMYTCALLDTWLGAATPGQLWDKGGTPQPDAGHAVLLNGKNAKGNYILQTWGFSPPIELTPAGMLAADPELIVSFSAEWFDPVTGKAPNGMSYADAAALWVSLGGHTLPPFTPVGPNPPPQPAGGFTGTLTYVNGVLTAVTPGAGPPPVAGPTVEADLKAAGVHPTVIADVLQLLVDVKAKKGIPVIAADVLKIINDLSTAADKLGRREDPCRALAA